MRAKHKMNKSKSPRYKDLKEHVLDLLRNNLSSNLHYHDVDHTLDVLAVCKQYVDIYNLNRTDAELLEIAAVSHDCGFTASYNNHEEVGANIMVKIMPNYGFDSDDIDKVLGMIMATKIPQSPQTHLEEIIADSDLDYLGRSDYDEISQRLYDELSERNLLNDSIKWLDLQISFLTAHGYHTDYAIKNRRPNKLKRLYLLEDQRKNLIWKAKQLA